MDPADPPSDEPAVEHPAAAETSADVGVLVSAWYRRAREAQFAHYVAAGRLASMNLRLGVPSIIFSAAAGTTLFATAQEQTASMVIPIAAGFVALMAGVLSALQTFLAFNERADKHRSAGAAYGMIRREMEQLQILLPTLATADLRSALTGIRGRLDEIASGAPNVSRRAWRKAQSGIAHTARPEGFTQTYLRNQSRASE